MDKMVKTGVSKFCKFVYYYHFFWDIYHCLIRIKTANKNLKDKFESILASLTPETSKKLAIININDVK